MIGSVRDGPAPLWEDLMSNEREAAMVAPSTSDDGRSSMVSSPRAQEQYIDIGVAEITPRQEAAIRALVAGRTYSEAAAAGGVDRATLFRWRTLDDDFKNALETLREQEYEQACDRFRSLTQASLKAIENGLAKGDDPRLGLSVLRELNRSSCRIVPVPESKEYRPKKPPVEPQLSRNDQQVRDAIRELTPWQVKNTGSLLALGLAAHNAQMAAKFRAHFGLPDDFPVNREQIDLAASGALPDPATYDPRKDTWRFGHSVATTPEKS